MILEFKYVLFEDQNSRRRRRRRHLAIAAQFCLLPFLLMYCFIIIIIIWFSFFTINSEWWCRDHQAKYTVLFFLEIDKAVDRGPFLRIPTAQNNSSVRNAVKRHRKQHFSGLTLGENEKNS